MITVPDGLVSDLVRQGGADARRWAEALPALVSSLLPRWDLAVDGPPRHGANALVLPVRRGSTRAALKVSWADVSDEAAALVAWAGCGAVRLLDAAPGDGALLLERLDADRTLRDVPLSDAVPAVAGVLDALSGVRAADDVLRAADLATSVGASVHDRSRATGEPLPARVLDRVRAASAQLGTDDAADLVHADLHWGNVLAGEREPWLAVDPRPRSGRAELSLPELLWTRADELSDASAVRALLADLVSAAGLDAGVAHAWVVVRCADYLLWGLEHGLTEDPVRCRRVLDAVLG